MGSRLERLETARLRLEPISADTARAIVSDDLSGLSCDAGLRPGEGWPHEGTRRGMAMAIKLGHPPGWLIVADGVIIGDCGVHAEVDEAGRVEIGYGLAAPYQGLGYGTEAVRAITEWLLRLPEVREVRAETLARNAASRRVLEKTGFRTVGGSGDHVLYRRIAGPA